MLWLSLTIEPLWIPFFVSTSLILIPDRIRAWLKLEGNSGGHQVQVPLSFQAESHRISCPGLCPNNFWISSRTETLPLSWTTCTSTRAQLPAKQKKTKNSYVQTEPTVFEFFLLIYSVTGHGLDSFIPSFQIFVHIDEVFCKILFA